MTIDQALIGILALAILYRYHRNEINKAEERFEKCDKERVLLHNLYYQKFGADFAEGGAVADELIEQEPETSDSRIRDMIQRKKLELKRIARTRPSQLGHAMRDVERKGRPRLSRIRPPLDPGTKQAAAEQAKRMFSDVEQQVNHGRPVDNGG